MADSSGRKSNALPAASTAEREIVITRVFDAPRHLVFDAWTDPTYVGSWYGPTGFYDFQPTPRNRPVRPGGVWRFIMHGPDGTDYSNKIVYLEVVKPERLVYDHGEEWAAQEIFSRHHNVR